MSLLELSLILYNMYQYSQAFGWIYVFQASHLNFTNMPLDSAFMSLHAFNHHTPQYWLRFLVPISPWRCPSCSFFTLLTMELSCLPTENLLICMWIKFLSSFVYWNNSQNFIMSYISKWVINALASTSKELLGTWLHKTSIAEFNV